jgi:hypothetical membrane protein
MIIPTWFFVYFSALTVLTVIGLVVCIKKYEGYSILEKEVSHLGSKENKNGRLFNSIYILFGLSLLLLFYFLFNAGLFNLTTFIFFSLGGISIFFIGIFPKNFIGTFPESILTPHHLFAEIAFGSFYTGSILFLHLILDSEICLWMIIPSILVIIAGGIFFYITLFYETKKIRKRALLKNFCFWEWMLFLAVLLEIICMFILLI